MVERARCQVPSVDSRNRRKEGDEYHYIDDTPIRATRYKGVFGDMVKMTKEVFVFENG